MGNLKTDASGSTETHLSTKLHGTTSQKTVFMGGKLRLKLRKKCQKVAVPAGEAANSRRQLLYGTPPHGQASQKLYEICGAHDSVAVWQGRWFATFRRIPTVFAFTVKQSEKYKHSRQCKIHS
jgi:hypothetical protein